MRCSPGKEMSNRATATKRHFEASGTDRGVAGPKSPSDRCQKQRKRRQVFGVADVSGALKHRDAVPKCKDKQGRTPAVRRHVNEGSVSLNFIRTKVRLSMESLTEKGRLLFHKVPPQSFTQFLLTSPVSKPYFRISVPVLSLAQASPGAPALLSRHDA